MSTVGQRRRFRLILLAHRYKRSQSLQLAQDEVCPLVAQHREAQAGTTQGIEIEVDCDQRFVEQGCGGENGAIGSKSQAAAPE